MGQLILGEFRHWESKQGFTTPIFTLQTIRDILLIDSRQVSCSGTPTLSTPGHQYTVLGVLCCVVLRFKSSTCWTVLSNASVVISVIVDLVM